MGILLRRNSDCRRLGDALEENPDRSVLAPELRQHLERCSECQAMADEFDASRALLQALPPRRHAPSPWFAQHVILAIAARESLVRRSLETWTLVPRLAVRLTLASALALLVAGTWLYERPSYTAPNQGGATESLFDSSPSAPAQDDLLVSSGYTHE